MNTPTLSAALNKMYQNRGPVTDPPSRQPPRAPSAFSYEHGGDTGSDIYVTSAAYKAPSEISGHTNYSRKAGARLEAMSAPNPFCPNIKGVCCLMLLLNLGLILVTLGFVIVIQFMEPLFVWVLGIIFLIFGFLTLIGSMVYCVIVCRDARTPSQVRNEDLYWTKHWQKDIGYTPRENIHKHDDERDQYSTIKLDDKYSDRNFNRY